MRPGHPQQRPRRETRFRADLPSILHDRGIAYPCVTSNLSRSGALLAGPQDLGAGDLVRLQVQSHAGDLRFELRADVIRRASGTDECWRELALRFLVPRRTDRRRLEQLLARLDHGEAPILTTEIPSTTSNRRIERSPLAQRLVLARRATSAERELLWRDQHPRVLEALVRHQATRSREIARLIERPDLSPSTLEVVARDPRFGRRREIAERLIRHPATSRRLAERVRAGLASETCPSNRRRGR